MACEPFKPVTRRIPVEILGVSLTILDAQVASGARAPSPSAAAGEFIEFLRRSTDT
jgi:hypothetical protein